MSPSVKMVQPTGPSKSPPPVLGPELNGIRLIAAEFDAVTDFDRDDIEKRDEYLAAGVKEYWVFDRFRRLMSVYRQTESGIVEEIIREQDTYRPVLLPGFELRLIDLLSCEEE